MTGIILTVTIKLKKIHSPCLEQKIIEFYSYKDFFRITNEKYNYEYNVLWIENFTKSEIKGLNFLAKHSRIKKSNLIINNVIKLN